MIKITAVEGNYQKLDGGAMFGNAPRTVWEKWCVPDEKGRIKLACRSMLAEIGDGEGKINVLCETGIGCFFEPKLAERFGVEEREHMLVKNLWEKVKLRDEDIHYVILSHLHFDHAGGLMPSYGDGIAGKTDLLFPNAKYVVGAEALARAKKPHSRDKASFIPGMVEKLVESGRLIVVENDNSWRDEREEGWRVKELKEILSFRFSNGHTPGQMHAVLKGKAGRVVFAGDLVPGLAWVRVPITMGYDRFPEQLIDEKIDLYGEMKQEDFLFFTHDVNVAMAHVVDDKMAKKTAEGEVLDKDCIRIEL